MSLLLVPTDGEPMPPPVEQYDDRVPCPHCGRKFAALPAERHIARCKDIRAKPNTLKRSEASGAPMAKPKAAAEPAAAVAAGAGNSSLGRRRSRARCRMEGWPR